MRTTKNGVVFVLIVLLQIICLADVYMFQDSTVFWREVNQDITVPDNVYVICAQGGQWWIEDNRPDWMEMIKKVKLVKIDDLPKEPLQFVSSSPIIFKGEKNKYYVYLSQGKGWYMFVWNGKSERILHVNGDMRILFACDGYWKAMYTFKNERELGMSVKLKSSCVDEGNVYLISGRMFEKPQEILKNGVYTSKALALSPKMPEVSQLYEKHVFHLGNVRGMLNGAGIGVFDTVVNSIEKKYELSFPVERSSSFQKAQYVIYIKNDPYNGLGFYLPDGDVIVFRDIEEGEEIPVGNFKFEGCVSGDYVKIIENKTKDVLGKVIVLQSKRISSDRYERKIMVKIRNLRDDDITAKITLYGKDIDIISSDESPALKSSDRIVYELDIPSGEYSFNVILSSSW